MKDRKGKKREKADPASKKGANHVVSPLNFLEAATRFELVNNGFADRSLTTWVCRQTL